jgi:predicted DNA-binding transcriptional regulator YafY
MKKKRAGTGIWSRVQFHKKKSLEFFYKSKREEEVTHRKIDPYLLVFYRDHWNVIGFSHKRDAIRNFVLDRMSEVKILEENFYPKTKIDTEALIFGSNESGQKIELLVDNSVDRAFRANLPTKIFKENRVNYEKIKVSIRFENLEYLNEWLLQFGDKIEIIYPDELKNLRKNLLNKMLMNLD